MSFQVYQVLRRRNSIELFLTNGTVKVRVDCSNVLAVEDVDVIGLLIRLFRKDTAGMTANAIRTGYRTPSLPIATINDITVI